MMTGAFNLFSLTRGILNRCICVVENVSEAWMKHESGKNGMQFFFPHFVCVRARAYSQKVYALLFVMS